MTIRTACITAGAAALALPAFAGSPKNITPQLGQPGRFVQPDRAASAMLVNGRLVLTSDWIDLGATTRNPPDTYAHDAFEDDGTGFPSDDAGAGCTAQVPVGSRWYLGGTYNNPFASNDMTTDAAGAGALCEGLNLAWWWNIDEVGGAPYDDTDGNGELDQDCIIAVFSTDTMAADCTDDGTTTAFPGVIYTFASLNDGESPLGAGYYFTNIDLTGSGLSHEMPADGIGGYIMIIGSAEAGGVITITGGAGDIYSQPMLWGTGEDDPGPSVRVGTQDLIQYDDDAPTDGVHDLAFECYDYTFGVCPNPLGVCLGFRYKASGGGCPCPGDLNNDGLRDISDLALFLSQFGSTDGGCDDINADGVTDISDLALILSSFGSPC
jgi:hypothetical protein